MKKRFMHTDNGRNLVKFGYCPKYSWYTAWRAVRRRRRTGQFGIVTKIHPAEPDPGFLVMGQALRTARYVLMFR